MSPKNKVSFWKKQSSSIKKLYRKLKYLDKTRATYFGVSIFLATFCLFTGGTYSYFVFSEYLNAAVISIAKLNYSLTSTESAFEDNSTTVWPMETLQLTLSLKSLNDQNTRYALDYIASSPDVKVYYVLDKEQNVEGEIGGLNSVIDINLVIENTGDAAQTVNFDLKGGYLQNELESNIVDKWVSTILDAQLNSDNKLWAHRDDVQKIIFEDALIPKEDAEYIYDISTGQDGSIMSYLVPSNEDDTKYIAYIQSAGKVKANKNSSFLFSLFSNLESIENIFLLDVSNVIDMTLMFDGCSSLTTLDLSGLDTSNVTNMYGLFSGCSSLITLNLSGLDMGNVTDMSEIFCACSSLITLDLSGLNTSKVTNMFMMFSGCSSLTTLDLSGFDTSNVTNMYGLFSGCSSLITLDLSGFNAGKVTDMSSMFEECYGMTTLDLSGFDTRNVTDMSNMFSNCINLTTLNLSGFNTRNVVSMYNMFNGCFNLTTLDLSGFDTSNVTNMSSMFEGCYGLTTLDLSGFDTRNVTDMSYMFYSCSRLSTTLTIFGTNCTSYETMFSDAAIVEGAQIIVKYTSDASDLVDKMMETKSSNSNVVKESQPE